MNDKNPQTHSSQNSHTESAEHALTSDIVDRVRANNNVWNCPNGQLLLPEVFGFCRGVKRALAMLQNAIDTCEKRNIVLLGEIIHNPWVNDFFRNQGVRILTREQSAKFEEYLGPQDCAVIPAFGVPLPIEQRLRNFGCEVIDTSCGDVRRLWLWTEKAVNRGYAVLIYGRSNHDETVVTKSRLDAAGGKYLVVNTLDKAKTFCDLVLDDDAPNDALIKTFGNDSTNAANPRDFRTLAQVSQTTMLYNDTMELRRILGKRFAQRWSGPELESRLLFHPTVCRATQQRQQAATELCKETDLAVVVGGFGSSNTRHLFELASQYAPALFIERAEAILSKDTIETANAEISEHIIRHNWLPEKRPLRVVVLAGASCPEIVVGQVLERLAKFLS